MNEFKAGDIVYTWSLIVFGRYIPFFDEYEITKIVDGFALLDIHNDDYAPSICDKPPLIMPFEFLFKTKNEAIDYMIKSLQKLKV